MADDAKNYVPDLIAGVVFLFLSGMLMHPVPQTIFLVMALYLIGSSTRSPKRSVKYSALAILLLVLAITVIVAIEVIGRH